MNSDEIRRLKFPIIRRRLLPRCWFDGLDRKTEPMGFRRRDMQRATHPIRSSGRRPRFPSHSSNLDQQCMKVSHASWSTFLGRIEGLAQAEADREGCGNARSRRNGAGETSTPRPQCRKPAFVVGAVGGRGIPGSRVFGCAAATRGAHCLLCVENLANQSKNAQSRAGSSYAVRLCSV